MLFATFHALGQNMFVYDKQSGEPIRGVNIQNAEGRTVTRTDELGLAPLNLFGEDDLLRFEYPDYRPVEISYFSLKQINFRMGLERSPAVLYETVLSTGRMETRGSNIPQHFEVIKQDPQHPDNAPEAADLLMWNGESFTQKDQLSGGAPTLRGFSMNRLLIQLDGIRLNSGVNRGGIRHNLLQVDVNSLERTELIYGPGSVVNGSGNLGGVIDFRLLEAGMGIDDTWTTAGSATAGIASAAFQKTIHADLNFMNNKWSLLTAVSYSDFDDLLTGKLQNEYATRPHYAERVDGVDSMVVNTNPDRQVPSGYHRLAFLARIRQQLTRFTDWTLSFYLTQTGEVPRYDKLLQYTGDTLKYAVWADRPQQWFMNSLKLNLTGRTKAYDIATFTFSYQNSREGREKRKFGDDQLVMRKENVNTLTANGDFRKSLQGRQQLLYGLEMFYTTVAGEGLRHDIVSGQESGTTGLYPGSDNKHFLAAAYFKYQKDWAGLPLTLVAGIRLSYDYLGSRIPDIAIYHLPYSDIVLSNLSGTGSVGLIYLPGSWQFRVNLSTGYRSPGLDEIAAIFQPLPGMVVMPNPGLEPEYLYNLDLGIGWGSSERIRLEVSPFISYLTNTIVLRSLNGNDTLSYDGEEVRTEIMTNTDNAIIYGANLSFNWNINAYLTLRSVLTLIAGEDSDGYPFRESPPLYGHTTFTYTYNGLTLALSSNYNAAVPFHKFAPRERGKAYLYPMDTDGNPYSPGWWTLDLRVSYAFPGERFTVSAGVRNLMNYRYRPYTWGISAPGRDIGASVTYRF